MTVSTELSHEEYTGNGVTTDFDFRFRIFEAKHLVVSVADPDGTERILTNGTDYTLRDAGSYRGGKVILKMPLATGWKIGIARDLPAVQETDLRNQGKFFSEVHEDAFDYLTMLIQKSLGYLSLCLRKPSFISDHYDAKGNKISNLGKPVKNGDAVDLGTMKEHINSKDKRSLRVADKDIPALPSTAVRANKLLSFDDAGNPVVIVPESGSAADVLIMLASKGGERYVSGFSSISEMVSDTSLLAGDIVSTGGSRWKMTTEQTPLKLNNGLYAKLINELYVDDFAGTGTDKINGVNAYITAGISSSYASLTVLEEYKYSLRPVTVLFTSRVESSVPLLLMRHVHYDQVGAQTYFNRQMPVGLYYAPEDLNSAATEPVVFVLSGGLYVRKNGALIGTTDNDISNPNEYVTLSDGPLVDISISTSPSVKIGMNAALCPGIKSTTLSVGISEGSGNNVSSPLVGIYLRWSWGFDFRSPKVLAMRQGIVTYLANAGGRFTNPYVARAGSNSMNDQMVYTTSEWTDVGKNKNTGITCITTRDFVIDEPIVEWWQQAYALYNSDLMIRKPHVEDVGGNMIMRHNFVITNSYVDIDNWSQINYTCLSYAIYFVGQDGDERKVLLRGMSPVGGFTNGLVGGVQTNSPLRVDNLSSATTDYGSVGDWTAISYANLDYIREIHVNPITGSDQNTGLAYSRPLATLERAIEIINKINRNGQGNADFVINVYGSISLSRVVRSHKGFRLNASSVTITTSTGGYIELYGNVNVKLNSGTISGFAEPLFRHLYGKLNIEVGGTTKITTPAIVRTLSSHSIDLSQTGGNTMAILKYIDGSGIAVVTINVKSESRNTAIDSAPTSTNQLVAASRFSN
ncbi:hypothetical protein [Morganella morganii]|uniref:hypothetical protein n=1 Tax=Morganella morganii TaxID=582 RepID=UPI0034E57402